ncbi:MAG: LysR substrate-binding domain-containing protein, partial [Ardenticatenaceae bacterium]
QGESFIMRENGSATRQAGETCLAKHKIAIKVVMELGSNEAVKRAVAAGLGIGMVSKFGVIPDSIAGFVKVLRVSGWQCRRPLTVFYRDEQHLPAAQRAFLRFLRDEKPLPEMPDSLLNKV